MNPTEQNILKEIDKIQSELEEHGDCESDNSRCNYDEIWTCMISYDLSKKLDIEQAKLEGYQLAQKEKGLIKKEDILKILNELKMTNSEVRITYDIAGKENNRFISFDKLKAELEKL